MVVPSILLRVLCVSVLSLCGAGLAAGAGPPDPKARGYRALQTLARSESRPGLSASDLRCEYLTNPCGLDEPSPRLSWIVESPERGQRQTAYHLLVASSKLLLNEDRGDLWDTGKVADEETIGAAYQGKKLRSNQCCYWKVRVWDRWGRSSDWSEPAQWSMGLLSPADWRAQWIGCDAFREQQEAETTGTIAAALVATNGASGTKSKAKVFLPRAQYLRTQFAIEKPLARAVLYASALGLVDMHLNGRRVSEDYFTPGWTDYHKRVYYRAFDVTDLLRLGENAIGAVLADGWFSGYVGYKGGRDTYGKHPRVRAQLRLEFLDGSTADIVTGPDWKAAPGPILEADFLKGETYDARLECPGWNQPGCDDVLWKHVTVGSDEVKPLLQAHPGPPVRAFHEFKPRTITEPKPGRYVLDFGQNFAGVARLQVRGQPGQKITLRFAERLNPHGTLYTLNLRAARATDTYICKGNGLEIWQPRFTFHGFQYAEITGLKSKPDLETLTGIALSSDTPVASTFTCSNPMLNQLARNIYWTQRANFIDVPTDCPQRDERLGWTGDAQVFIGTATLNTDVQAFFSKWLVDLEDGQRPDGQFPCVAPYVKCSSNDGGPAWADAGVICPWTIYSVYGDRRILGRHYPAMTRFIEFCRQRSTPDLLPPEKFRCYGDWLNLKAETPKDLVCTAYFAYSTRLTARAAAALGKAEDAERFEGLFEKIRQAFNQAYVGRDGRIKGDTQASYVLALAFDLVQGERARLAAQYLVENIKSRGWHLSTGFVGTKDLMLALSKVGRSNVAYRLLQNDTFPSWGFSIKNGATSIWERWDGWTPEKGFQVPRMNSFAHYSFGAVYQWMVENIGGIVSAGPAYKEIRIAPQFDERVSSAAVSYRSVRGLIATEWKRETGHRLLSVTIPANTTATVTFPAQAIEQITESGRPVSQSEGIASVEQDRTNTLLVIGSGTYTFALRNNSAKDGRTAKLNPEP